MNRPKRPTPPPLTKTERQALEDLIRRGARALNPTEGNRLLRLLELDQANRAQERRTAGVLMAQVQQLGGQLKDMTTDRDRLARELRSAEDELAMHRQQAAKGEADRLRAHILDIDAHATPYGDIPDEPGYVGTYLLTAGALHRALGTIGHGAPSCQAEAQLAVLHEGEEPYGDERAVPTPAQWIWRWNRSTPAERLAQAARLMDRSERLSNAYQALVFQMGHPDWAQAVHDALTGKPYEPRVQTAPQPALQARLVTPVVWCDQCTRPRHPGYTCDEITELAKVARPVMDRLYEQAVQQQEHLGAAFTAPDASEPTP